MVPDSSARAQIYARITEHVRSQSEPQKNDRNVCCCQILNSLLLLFMLSTVYLFLPAFFYAY